MVQGELDPDVPTPPSSIFQRPWGLEGEAVPVYLVALESLVPAGGKRRRGGPPTVYDTAVKEAAGHLPEDNMFEYAPQVVRDAVDDHGPFGRVAEFCSVKVLDDGADAHRFIDAVAIVRSMYSVREARARLEENTQLALAFSDLALKVDSWLRTKRGSERLDKEVERRYVKRTLLLRCCCCCCCYYYC